MLVRPAAAQDHAAQTWHELELQRPLGEKQHLETNGQVRFGGAFRDLLEGRAGLGLTFEPTAYLRVSPGYVLIKEWADADARTLTHRVRLDGTLRRKLFGLELTNRHRLEQGDVQRRGSARYRARLQLERTLTLRGRSIAPFVADEVIYEWTKGAWTRNRFVAGVGFPLGPLRKAEIYYILQHDLDVARPARHVAGMTWALTLPGGPASSSGGRAGR